MESKVEECIKSCMHCYKVCTKTMVYCLEKDGTHAEVDHINLLKDCAKICGLSSDFMLRDSEFAAQLCELCAQLCESCAKDCDTLDGETMRQCAETCRECAKACRNMVEM